MAEKKKQPSGLVYRPPGGCFSTWYFDGYRVEHYPHVTFIIYPGVDAEAPEREFIDAKALRSPVLMDLRAGYYE